MLPKDPESIGPFRIVGRLGNGGMAEAFLGLRTGPGGFEQRVCVKRVLPAYGRDDEFVRLFLREARLAALLTHRNITRVVDFGRDGDCYFLALELVEGTDLRQMMRSRPSPQRVAPEIAALIGVEIADALEHAHTRGGSTGAVVHRDVSPANILVSLDGDVKLTDFGISKALGDALASRSEFVRGNLWYMAPEQLRRPGVADPRSDLFSLGVVLFQILSGKRPYEGATDLSAMMALAEGRRVSLREVAPHVSEPLERVVERLLAHDPADRFASAAEASDALAAASSAAGARRELRRLVREAVAARKVPPPPARITEAIPATEATPTEVDIVEPVTRAARRRIDSPAPSQEPEGSDGLWRAGVPASRWARYNHAPGVWANADAAARTRPARARRRVWPWVLLFLAGLALAALFGGAVALVR